MGYLTTVTICNDGLSLLKSDPVDFCSKLYYAAISQEVQDLGVGSFCNFANVQKTRHADDHTTYVHMGNCVTEVSAHSEEFKRLLSQHPDFAAALVGHLEREVKDLKKMIKEQKVSE
jgi:hypothetical protein